MILINYFSILLNKKEFLCVNLFENSALLKFYHVDIKEEEKEEELRAEKKICSLL